MSFTGDEITSMRTVLGWSRDEFASMLGASPSIIRRWEKRLAAIVPLESRNQALLDILKQVLQEETAVQKLQPFRRLGVRSLYVMLGLYYRDHPWSDERQKKMLPFEVDSV